MKCQICQKKKATVHLTELIDDQVTELHICEDCAREKSVQMEQQFGLADLLAGLSDFGKPVAAEKPQQALQCDHCGTTYQEFKKHGRLGCSECYQSFRSQLGNLLKKIHGASSHSGKTPKYFKGPEKIQQREQVSNNLDELKQQLQQAVLCEDFERAAELRDKIRAMEQNKG
ncbi:MAG: UvrB/UvrC motif-containing protein [Candidatus Omnitrophota bacterium]